MSFQPSSLHKEIHRYTATEDSSRDFLMSRNVIKQIMNCSSCSASMDLIPCSSSKSTDLFVWKCRTCKKFKNIRSDSYLAGSKLSFQTFLTLVFYFSMRSLTNVEVAVMTGLSDKAVGDWRKILSNAVADWLLNNCTPLGGPGKIVEVDEAKFGKKKVQQRILQRWSICNWRGGQRDAEFLPSTLPWKQQRRSHSPSDYREMGSSW